ncbi:MAG: hypothetical protein J6K89_09890 [Oscillospiraceae bacterium]|nr:hypothetical protein [Oscillospiraceae bacterium]
MKFLKEHYKSFILVPILFVALICTCPLPRHIEFESNGWQLDMSSKEALFEESAEISIEGWHYQFLFFDDFANLDVHIESSQAEYEFSIDHNKPLLFQHGDATFAHINSAHFEGTNLRRVHILSQAPWQNILIELEGLQAQGEQILGVFAASEAGQADLTALIEEYERLRLSN